MALVSIESSDQRVLVRGVTWDRFESYLSEQGDAGPRVTYLEGTLEVVSPSRSHGTIKKRFAEVVEAYLDHLGIEWEGIGSWLIKRAPDAGLEPDECYLLGNLERSRPDLAIEVAAGQDKLEVYRRLQIAEVWFWRDDRVAIYVLGADGYDPRDVSACLPSFDFAIVTEMLELTSLSAVRRALRARFPTT